KWRGGGTANDAVFHSGPVRGATRLVRHTRADRYSGTQQNTSSSAAGSVQAACPCDRCSGVRDRAEAVHDERTRHGGSFLLPEYIDSCCWRHRRTICVSAFVCASARIGSSPPSRDNPDRFIIVTFRRACNYGMRGVIPHLAS